MTGSINRGETIADAASRGVQGPEGWRAVRDNPQIQFEPIEVPPPPPREPGLLEQFFGLLGDLLSPLGELLGVSWPVMQWVLLGALGLFVLVFALRTFGPLVREGIGRRELADEQEWQPDREESLALLEDADQMAADGRFAEAVRLLLQRSVGQIATARPEWVRPSSTARELSSLPQLSDAARAAFGTIAERVERSLFALRTLDHSDWETAREAYSSFALAEIDGWSGKARQP